VSADPKNAAARFWSARYAERRELLPEAEQQYQRAIELDGSPEYRFALLRMYLSPPWRSVWADAAHDKRQTELAAELEPLAKTAQQFTLLALNALLASDAVRGDYFASRAVAADPGCTSCLHAAAAGAYLTGEFAKALELETRAMRLLPASASRETRAVFEHAAAAYRKAAQHPGEKPSGDAPTLLVE
jgi:tetratricopeptide (TPR) repeat protein